MKALPGLALLLLAGCGLLRKSSSGPPPIEALQSDELGSMTNVSVCGDLWVGGQPHRDDLDLASRRGIELILDLSGPGELGFDPAATCRRLKMLYVSAPLRIAESDDFRQEDLNRVLEILEYQQGRTMLMFSSSGSEAALAFALHRARTEGLTSEEAELEARRAGMKPGRAVKLLKQQFELLSLGSVAVQAGASRPGRGSE